MLDPRRHRKLDLLAALVALGRIGQDAEVIGPTADEIFDQIVRVLGPYLRFVQRLPGAVSSIFDHVVLDQIRPFDRRHPRYQEPVTDLGYGQVPRDTRFWS